MSQDNFTPFRINARRDVADARGVEPKERKEVPNRNKDFKEIMDDGDEKSNLLSDEKLDAAKKMAEVSDAKRSTSLFDLAKAKTSSLKEAQFSTEQSVAKDLPEALQNGLSAKELNEKILSSKSAKIDPQDIEGFESDDMENMATKSKKKFNSEYAQHSPDISYLDPSALGAASQKVNAISTDKSQQIAPVQSPIHDIVTELINKLTRIETSGQTDTIVTIHKEGMFKDAIIVISEFKTANGQLNIAFENLKNEAKLLLDSQPNRDVLFERLAEKGYVINQMVTTTITEHKPPAAVEEARQQAFGRQNDDREDDQGKPKKRQG